MEKLPPYARFTFIAISIALVIVAMVHGSALILPLAWGILFSLLMLPLHRRIEKALGNRRTLAAVLSVFILILIVGGVLYLLSFQMVNLVNDLPAIVGKLKVYLDDFRLYVEEHLGVAYQDQPTQFLERLTSFLQDSVNTIGVAVTNTIKTVVMIGLLPIYVFFILYYRHRFTDFLKMLYREGHREAVARTAWKASSVVQRYLSGMLIVTVIVAVMVLILFLSMGIRHALFFAVFVAVFNLIPYVGVLIASVVSILYVLITTDSLLYPVLTFACLWGIQLIENNLITPFVVGRQIQLNPLAVILVIILGGMIWGVSGMVLFIPLLGGLKVILDETPGLRPYGFLLGDEERDMKK